LKTGVVEGDVTIDLVSDGAEQPTHDGPGLADSNPRRGEHDGR
jgi:hypothetical protein